MKFDSLKSFLAFLLPRLEPRRFARGIARRLRALWIRHLPEPKPGKITFSRILSPIPGKANAMALKAIDRLFDAKFSLTNKDYVIQKGQHEEFGERDAVLMAHWDPDNIVDPYVLHLARHFKEIGKKVILCSAAPLAEPTRNTDAFDAIVCRTCPGYDMTSWKACFTAFPSLFNANEITLTNDSSFGPFGSFAPVYETMGQIPCDFWGLTLNREILPHVQSFFLVFRKSALRHIAFRRFLDAIPTNCVRDDIIRIETRLSLWLELQGLQGGCFRPYNTSGPALPNPMGIFWLRTLQDGVPLLKRDLLKYAGHIVAMPWWESQIKYFDYPMQIIFDYFYRIGIDISPVLCPGKRSKTFPPSILSKELKFNEISVLSFKQTENIDNLDIAVFIHCFYTQFLEQLSTRLKYLPKQTNFFISTDSKEKASIIFDKLNNYGFNSDIRIFPNKGWDIGPFLDCFVKEAIKYKLILKIHVKGSTNIENESANRWRNLLYNSILGDSKHIEYILNLFISNQNLGILAPPSLPYMLIDASTNAKHFYSLAKKMGVDIPRSEAVDFPAGSMFWARGKALKPILDLGLTLDDFEETSPLQRDGTLAHAVERLFFLSACLEGYSWGRIAPAPYGFLGAPRIDR